MADFILDKFYLFFQGLLIFQAIFFAAIYFRTRKKEVGYYTLYLLLTSVYFFYNAVHTFFGIDDALIFESTWYWWVNVPVIIAFEILYILFLKSLIEGIVQSTRLNNLFRWTLYGFLLLLPLHATCMWLDLDNSIVFLLSHIWLSGYGIAVVYTLFRQKALFAQLVSVGIIVNILGGTATIIATLLGEHGIHTLLTVSYPIFFLRAGMLIDIFLFQMALLTKWHLQEQLLLKSELESKFQLSQVKSKISADLHDEMGSVLSSISLQTEVVKRKLKRHENVDELIQQINTASKEMISRMSDIVWSLRPSNENLHQVIDRIDTYCATTLPDHQINYRITNQLSDSMLCMQVQELKELYLIIKEALNNCLKHAACTDIDLHFAIQDKKLTIKIEDNGQGFDLQKPIRSMGGDGLKNMKLRAERIGGIFMLQSTISKGTRIEVCIPIENSQN